MTREPFGGPLPMGPGGQQVRMTLTAEGRARAEAVAVLLGAKSWRTVVFLVMYGQLEEAAGKLDDDGKAMLAALHRELMPG